MAEDNNETKNTIQIGDIGISSNQCLEKIHKQINALLKDDIIKNYLTIQYQKKKISYTD